MENEGLLLAGTVQGRVKRHVGANNAELVTYKILAGSKEYYVKDWNPEGVYFKMGEKVMTPVTVKIYNKNGHSLLDYSVARKGSMQGEAF